MAHFNWRRLRDARQEGGDNRAWRAMLTAQVLEDEECKEDGRRLCKTNLIALCYVLGFCLITEDVHREGLDFFPEIDTNKNVEELAIGVKRRRTLMLPRNTYKSTMNKAYIVQLILHYYLTIAILIMCGSKELAFAFVDQIASFFVNPGNRPLTLFQALFPELIVLNYKGSGAFTTTLRQREPTILEPMLWGNSLESSTTGWHPDVLIFDDIHTNRNSMELRGRQRVTKAYKLTRKILKPTGIEMMIGTPYGVQDIFNDQLVTAQPSTYDRVYKPALKLNTGGRLDANGFPEEDEMELLFPSILSYDFLKEEYEADYATFQSQYMLDSYGASEVIFGDKEMAAAIVPEDRLPMTGETFAVFRLPCRTLKWGSVAGAVGTMHNNRMYISEAVLGHYKPSAMAKLIHNTLRKHGLHYVSIEDSPGARIFQPSIDNYALTTGWEININWIEPEDDAAERDNRIRSMEPLITSLRLLFSGGIKLKPLMTSFVEYGMGDDSALPDVVSRVADNLPVSIAQDKATDDIAWQIMRERDHFNLVYGRGPYAPPEPPPPEIEREPYPDEIEYGENGLEILIPGLEY